MSSPEKSAVAVSSTVTSASPHGRVVPAERADAKYRISSTGKFRSNSRVRMTLPTWPVAPKTPIRMSTSLESGSDAGPGVHDAGAGRGCPSPGQATSGHVRSGQVSAQLTFEVAAQPRSACWSESSRLGDSRRANATTDPTDRRTSRGAATSREHRNASVARACTADDAPLTRSKPATSSPAPDPRRVHVDAGQPRPEPVDLPHRARTVHRNGGLHQHVARHSTRQGDSGRRAHGIREPARHHRTRAHDPPLQRPRIHQVSLVDNQPPRMRPVDNGIRATQARPAHTRSQPVPATRWRDRSAGRPQDRRDLLEPQPLGVLQRRHPVARRPIDASAPAPSRIRTISWCARSPSPRITASSSAVHPS